MKVVLTQPKPLVFDYDRKLRRWMVYLSTQRVKEGCFIITLQSRTRVVAAKHDAASYVNTGGEKVQRDLTYVTLNLLIIHRISSDIKPSVPKAP